MNADTPFRLAEALRDLSAWDYEAKTSEPDSPEARHALKSRAALNDAVAPFFRDLPPLAVVEGERGKYYLLYLGRVLEVARYSAATAQAIYQGDFPRPASPPRGPFGFPLPFPAGGSPEAAEFGPAASAAAIDGETA